MMDHTNTQVKPMNKRDPIHWLAFGFGSGLAPKAPGTFGTLMAVPLWYVMSGLSPLSYTLMLVVTFIVGCYFCHKTSADMGVHDHGGIVWDEFVGYWITMAFMPVTWWSALLGFALFRLFDIWKPWPIKLADSKVSGGFGIMIDDVLAGIYAWIVMYLVFGLYQ